MKEINVSVQRRKGPHDEPYMEDYKVPVETGMSILNVMDYIGQNCDHSFAYEASCRRGLCSVCVVKVNGKVIKSCLELAQEDLVIEGTKNLIKDLAFSTKKPK